MQAFGKGPADCHGLADRFHRRRQDLLGAGKFFKCEARDFGHDIVDRRLEGSRCRAAGNIVGDLVQGESNREFRRDFGDWKTGCLGGQRRGARDAGIHFNHDHAAILWIDRELHVGAAGLDADLAQHRERGVAHGLIFLIGQGQRRGDGNRIAGVHAHRVDVFDRADDDAIVRLVADNLHFEFLPAEHAFLDQNLVRRRGVDSPLYDLDVFRLVIGNAAAGSAHGEGRPYDRGQADVIEDGKRLRQGFDLIRARRRKADAGHRLAEKLAILGHVDGRGAGADHFHLEFFEHSHFFQGERAVERGLAAHGRQQREAAGNSVALLADDLGDDFRRDRLEVSAIGHVRIGHDRRRIGIDEDDPVSLLAQRLAGLGAGIIEFASLADDDRPGSDD